MLSSAAVKANVPSYTASTFTATGLPFNGLLNVAQAGVAIDNTTIYVRLSTGTQSTSGIWAINIATGVASQVCQQVNSTVSTQTGVCVSANGTIFFSEADAPNPYIYWYSVGPFTGTLLTPTLLFSSSDRTAYNYCGTYRLAVNPEGTALYMPSASGNIYKVTWSGGVGTFTVLVTNPALAVAVDGAGNLFGSGASGFALNVLVTPAGVATTVTQQFYPLNNYATYDADGCPIIINSGTGYLYKLKPPSGSSTFAAITSTAITTPGGLAVHRPTRTIYVYSAGTNGLLTFTPAY